MTFHFRVKGESSPSLAATRRGGGRLGIAVSASTVHAIGIGFEHEPQAVTSDGRGIAWWTVTYDVPASGKRVPDEGIFLVTLDDGRSREFHEWRNEREISRRR